MEIFSKETVCLKNHDYVKNIIEQFNKDGPSKLQVISDFDYTISRAHKNGVKCATTYGILEQAPFINEEYRYQADCLFKKYYPIEIDPYLSIAEKTPHMIEWTIESLNLMRSSGVTKGRIPEMVQASNACLRDGTDVLFRILHKNNVPLLIFSAGIGDILEEVLQQQNLLLPNIKIIANFLHFNEKNNVTGFQSNIIHPFNKNQSSRENKEYFEILKPRRNVLLLGDSLGDTDMIEGAENVDAILKFGFLNSKIEESLPAFLEKFDIVLIDDQSMDIVTGLLQYIM